MKSPPPLQLVFYGDDFTGSTDVLDLLSRGGIRAALFLKLPEANDLKAFPGVEAVGIAGTTRSMAPEAMEAELQPVLEAVGKLKTRHFHYKVCSTFDSSPTVGSIGKAMEVALSHFPSRFVPVLVGIPDLGRYCVFGNLFARVGTGKDGEVHRLDRHPSMRNHPITPATESDLRKVLALQTDRNIELFDIIQCRLPFEKGSRYLEDMLQESSSPAVLFDTVCEADLALPGDLMEAEADASAPLLSVGSSAVEMALLKAWGRQVESTSPAPVSQTEKPILVLSGSCSPVTSQQIQSAMSQGFKAVSLNTTQVAGDDEDLALAEAMDPVRAHLSNGRHVIVHTFLEGTEQSQRAKLADSASLLGTALGKIALRAAEEGLIDRVIIAGGDTSGFAAQAMGIEVLSFKNPFYRGAPMCEIHAPSNALHGMEINFKGGQVGSPDYFIQASGGETTEKVQS